MPSKIKPLSNTELEAYEAQRDLGADLLQSIREMKAGQGRVIHSDAIEARKKTGLSQSQFASLLGVSVRTLQGWEQGRKQPSGAARTLLAIAQANPAAVLAVVAKELPGPCPGWVPPCEAGTMPAKATQSAPLVATQTAPPGRGELTH